MVSKSKKTEENAVSLYEDALHNVYRRNYDRATEILEEARQKFPDEIGIQASVQSLRRLCQARQQEAADASKAPPLPALARVSLPHRRFGTERAVTEVRALMQQYAGVTRNGPGLAVAGRLLERMARRPLERASRDAVEVAALITAAAAARTESRGAHHRTDFPQPDSAQARRNFVIPEPPAAREVAL